jgi:hypothetical protein
MRYKEHSNGTGKKKGKSDGVQCIAETANSYGEIDDTVEILRFSRKEHN